MTTPLESQPASEMITNSKIGNGSEPPSRGEETPIPVSAPSAGGGTCNVSKVSLQTKDTPVQQVLDLSPTEVAIPAGTKCGSKEVQIQGAAEVISHCNPFDNLSKVGNDELFNVDSFPPLKVDQKRRSARIGERVGKSPIK
ncbi:hypothetical protein LINPERPRIM_LOCUS35677 [Linum perenne]